MINSAVQVTGNGYTPARRTCKMFNRTGAALAYGDIVGINLDFVATHVGIDPATETDTAAGYALSAAQAVTTSNANYVLMVCIDKAGIADDAEGNFGLEGVFECKVNGGNKKEFLIGTNAQVYLSPVTLAELQAVTTGIANVVGVALADTTGVQLAKCVFNGEAYRAFFGGDT